MVTAAEAAGVKIVTGDTKVVPRGGADKLFINTAGNPASCGGGLTPAAAHLQPGDVGAGQWPYWQPRRNDYGGFGRSLPSIPTCRATASPSMAWWMPSSQSVPQVRAMRDATRGGLATVLNEVCR